MLRKQKYKIIIEDESRLQTVLRVTATRTALIWCGAAAIVVIMAIGAFLAFLTPLRTLLPGYLKQSERAATEMQLMRLDSVSMAYETNAMFLDNIMSVLNPESTIRDSVNVSELTSPLFPDSIMPMSPEEKSFMEMMRDREKYDVSVVAPLASESLMFTDIADDGVFVASSRSNYKAEVLMARGSTIKAPADGTVINVFQSVRDGGTSVIIQHSKGFLSRISRLGNVLVAAGDKVKGGQTIALPNRAGGRRGEIVAVEMWHNGNRLVPYDYIGNSSPRRPRIPVIDVEVGRGR